MREGFLKKFIGEERYLQNPPLITKDFIKFCEERGIKTNEDELEFFEKERLLYPIIRIDRPIGEEDVVEFKKEDGMKYYRPSEQGLMEGEEEIRRYKKKHYSSYGFDETYKKYLLIWLKEGNLFDPSTKPFKEWSSFKGENLGGHNQRIVNFYSSFQIYWLEILKNNFSLTFNFASKTYNNKKIENLNDFIFELNKMDNISYFVGFSKRIELLKNRSNRFQRVLEFLLSIQSIYVPYGRSSSRRITLKGKDENWHEERAKFDPKSELKELKFTIDEIGVLYWIFSKKTQELLGVKRDDWIQLWESTAWDEKDKLEGDIRLGIEYLQWALMLKRFIEDYKDREILDIDELGIISHDDILKVDPSDMNKYGLASLRSARNKGFTDIITGKSFYHDRYKRLFYLANDFELNYQPRMMVFVEGETEEKLFPKIFEWYYDKPENLGIEIVNFKGVDKLLSTSKNATELRDLINKIQADIKDKAIKTTHRIRLAELLKDLKSTDIVISNWTSFISYNLEKWQIIPFFVSDNEGNVKHFLDAEEPIKFEGDEYNVPDEWKYLWGINNENKPFKGNNFELANFSDEEILLAINQVLDDPIGINEVKKIREQEAGIKKIDDRITGKTKRKIVKVLFNNLFENYEQTRDESIILNRPISKLIEKILNLANLNHPPVDRVIEIHNKETISNILNGKRVENG